VGANPEATITARRLGIARTGATTKAGRVLSKVNADRLEEALQHHGNAGDLVRQVLASNDDGDGDECNPDDFFDPDACGDETKGQSAAAWRRRYLQELKRRLAAQNQISALKCVAGSLDIENKQLRAALERRAASR
jgi:hypothetical protein